MSPPQPVPARGIAVIVIILAHSRYWRFTRMCKNFAATKLKR